MKKVVLFFVSFLPIVTLLGQNNADTIGFVITEEFVGNINKLEGRPEDFHEGLALVRKINNSGDALYGYIDKTGKLIIPFQYESALDFSDGLALVGKGGKFGYIDKTGKVVIPLQYDEWSWSFSEGLARVHRGAKYGYINKTGRLVIPFQFDWASDFREGFAQVGKNVGDGWTFRYGYINKTGNIVIPMKYVSGGNFHEGLVCVERDMDYKIGFLDKANNEVLPFQYTGIDADDKSSYFSEGLACVEMKGKYGYIDKNGKVVVPFHFFEGRPFCEGLAMVKNEDNKYGFIDTTGALVIPFQFENVPIDVDEDHLPVSHMDFKEGLARVCKDGKFGFVDKKGEIIIPIQYDYALSFQEGLARVWKNGKMGFVDKFGNCTITSQMK